MITEISNGDDNYKILSNAFINSEFELISTRFRKSESSYCEYVIEVTEGFYVDIDSGYTKKPIPEHLIGFWSTDEMIRYNNIHYCRLEEVDRLYKVNRVPVTTYEYERL